MFKMIIEFKDGKEKTLNSETPYRQVLRRINQDQVLYDEEGTPIDISTIKQIRPMEVI